MNLPKEAIIELQAIYKRQTGKTLTDAEAQVMAANLFRLFFAIYEPIPQSWLRDNNLNTTIEGN